MSESLLAPRNRILYLLERHPGLHLRELPRRLDLSLNAVRYHLDVLAREDAVTAHRSGRFERWFPSRTFSPEDRATISALRVQGERAVLEQLLRQGPCRFVELEAETRHSPATLVRYLNQLTTDDLVFLDSERLYCLRDPGALRMRLSVFQVRFPEMLADAATEIFE
ncbi:MAG: winged helix-turn-helix transcriptional regulator [Methanobacteriota archaeon]|nr:MAG: winged helix-turn-helix transcriptional regulator [Euryarchaeota archaeon]